MFELIVGSMLGAICSIAITHVYYKLSSRDLNDVVQKLTSELEVLRGDSEELRQATSDIFALTSITKRHVVAGTQDDPDFPYK